MVRVPASRDADGVSRLVREGQLEARKLRVRVDRTKPGRGLQPREVETDEVAG